MDKNPIPFPACPYCKYYRTPVDSKPCIDCALQPLSSNWMKAKKANYKKSNVSNNGG